MAKQSGLGDNFYVGGYNLSGDTQALGSIHGGPAALDMTSIDQLAHERQGGLRTGGIGWTSYFNDAAGQEHPALAPLPNADVICTYARGTTLGAPGAGMVAKQINYDGTRGNDGMFTFAVNAESNGFGLEWGVQLTAGLRTDTTATSPATGVDTLASAAFGAQAYLQVVSFTGTSVTVTIQGSPDNVTFSAIASPMVFAAASARGAQRISVPNTTVIPRYVRAITTGTFSNAVFNVVLVKNEAAAVVF